MIFSLPLSSVISSLVGPERRRGHRQVVPGASPARQTVSDLTACLATRGLEPERRRHTRHQLRPALCCSQAGTWSVLKFSKVVQYAYTYIKYTDMNTNMHRYSAEETVYNEGMKKSNLSQSSLNSHQDRNRKLFHTPQQGVIEGYELRKQFHKGIEVDIVESSLVYS